MGFLGIFGVGYLLMVLGQMVATEPEMCYDVPMNFFQNYQDYTRDNTTFFVTNEGEVGVELDCFCGGTITTTITLEELERFVRVARVMKRAAEMARLEKLRRRAHNDARALPDRPCEVCGSTTRIHKHHENYFYPLEVQYLCSKHHQLLHAERRRQGRDSLENYFYLYR